MAKKSQKSNKAVVGSSKKKSSLKLTRQTMLFGLVGILAFSIVAGFAWQKWQEHQLRAKALNYTYFFGNGGLLGIGACRVGQAINQSTVYHYYGINHSNVTARVSSNSVWTYINPCTNGSLRTGSFGQTAQIFSLNGSVEGAAMPLANVRTC